MSFFNFFEEQASNEWEIFNDNTHEMIEMYGIPISYLPRKNVNFDDLFGEDASSMYDEAIELKMYLEDTESFGGEDLFSKFGLEVNDTISLKIQQNYMREKLSGDEPEIGDLIKFKFSKDLFEITFIEDEEIFYVNGACTIYRFDTKKMDYSGEQLDTMDDDIDRLDGLTTATLDDSIRDFTTALEFEEDDPFAEN